MRVLILMLLTCFAFTSIAQNTVTGLVQDVNGVSIPGVSVIVKNTTTGTITDMDGKFELEVETLPVTLVTSFVGYKTKETVVTSSDAVTITMTEGVGLDEIMVTSTRTIRSQKQSAMSMTSMKAKEIQNKAASSQADILRSVPGITAEGGGGEVATNVFVRGLPSGGQYVFNPLEYDGMPVISTFGLNSSAHDVYIRNDLGIKSLDFPRGGAAILYGAGSVAGVINYISKTGTDEPENIIQLEFAEDGRYKADFFSGGKLGGEDSRTYYALSGFYRYDEGPLDTGLPTQGFQLRGNIKQEFDNGELIVSGQWIDDRVQFFLPLPLDGDSRDYAKGNDGKDVKTIQTMHAQHLSYATPDGIYRTPIKDGVATKGGYFMANYKHNFDNGLKMDAKMRYARYAHEFNLFLTGSGNPSTLNNFVTDIDPNASNISANRTGMSNSTIGGNDLVLVNTLLDRNRPMTDMATEMNVTKKFEGVTVEHNITAGVFLSRTEAHDQNVQTRYVSEFTSKPYLLDISYTSGGDPMTLSKNGLFNPGAAYSNNFITANKQAFYLTNEMKMDRWRIDVGFRYETIEADVSREGNTTYTMDSDASLSSDLQTVKWGNNAYLHGKGKDSDWAGVIAANYELNDKVNLYGNVTKGYFFPQPRGIKIASDGTVGSYKTEEIYQGELGVKYGSGKFRGTFATYFVDLNDRRNVDLRDDPNNPGTTIETVTTLSTKAVGVEATWGYELAENLDWSGSVTYQNHEYNESEDNPEYVGNELERQPSWLAYSALNYDNGAFDAGFSWNYTGKKFSSISNAVELDAINIFRLDAGYTMDLGEDGETLRFGVSVFNLFDDNGVTEGNPRDVTQSGAGEFFVGRPILPRRAFFRMTFSF
ncbi:TonB-dependent receptor [Marinifilum sp. JC070]|uniref:TonB-dependent receptor n=2 Tax=Marinifilum caeruleilacunae TaxID=2499076 RepID=A0ABX1WW87_9BACT|nr:TonB-dependent receptor [Marinifilum caeruleilacunae]